VTGLLLPVLVLPLAGLFLHVDLVESLLGGVVLSVLLELELVVRLQNLDLFLELNALSATHFRINDIISRDKSLIAILHNLALTIASTKYFLAMISFLIIFCCLHGGISLI